MSLPSAPNLSQEAGPDTAAAPSNEAAAPAIDPNRSTVTPDKYRSELNSMLDTYEKKQAKLAKEAASQPEPEPEGLREGESWDSVFNKQPPDVQRAMAEMRKMMTRKTQDLSRERKALEAQQQALANSGILDSLTQQAGGMPQDFDPFNPEHIQAAIEAKVAAKLKEVLEPINSQHKQREAVQRYEGFKADHPDLSSDPAVKAGVVAALQADKHLTLEAAYWMVKGKMLSNQKTTDEEKQAIRKRAMQRAATIGGTGRKPVGVEKAPDMKGMDAWQIYNTLLAQKS